MKIRILFLSALILSGCWVSQSRNLARNEMKEVYRGKVYQEASTYATVLDRRMVKECFIVSDTIPPKVVIMTPSSHANWYRGSNQLISWKVSSEVSIDSIFIDISYRGPKEPFYNLYKLPGKAEAQMWVTSDSLTKSAFIRVTAVDKTRNKGSALSDAIQISDFTLDVATKVLELVRAKDSSDFVLQDHGLGFNVGFSLDLLEGVKRSDLYAELRFFEPQLFRGVFFSQHDRESNGIPRSLRNLAEPGLTVYVRQSKTFPSADTVRGTFPLGLYIVTGELPSIPFTRKLEIRNTALGVSFHFPVAERAVRKNENSRLFEDYEIRMALTVTAELFRRDITSTFEPREPYTRYGRDSVRNNIYQEVDRWPFIFTGNIGPSLFLESPSFNLQLDVALYFSHGARLQTRANIFIKKLGGLTVGVRFSEERARPNATAVEGSSPPGVKPRETTGNDFEFYIAKYVSLEKFAEIFKP